LYSLATIVIYFPYIRFKLMKFIHVIAACFFVLPCIGQSKLDLKDFDLNDKVKELIISVQAAKDSLESVTQQKISIPKYKKLIITFSEKGFVLFFVVEDSSLVIFRSEYKYNDKDDLISVSGYSLQGKTGTGNKI
jgi:hypothetical protein